MLAKLIKYDLKFIYKQLIVFYIILITLAITAQLTANFDDSSIFILVFIHRFCQGAVLGFGIGTVISGILRTWARFKFNVYGDESYLTQTLPIKRSTIWTAKFLSSVIVILTTALVIILALGIVFDIPAIITENATKTSNSTFTIIMTGVIFILAVILQFIYTVQSGFLGIIIGHYFQNLQTLWAIIFGYLIYIIGEVVIVAFCMLVWANFDPTIYDALYRSQFENLSTLNEVLLGFNILYCFLITISYYTSSKLLQHNFNVE